MTITGALIEQHGLTPEEYQRIVETLGRAEPPLAPLLTGWNR